MKMFLFNLAQYSNSTPISIRTKTSAQSSWWSTPFELVPVFITWSHLELIALDHILDELLFACRLLYSYSNLSVLPLSDYILLVDEKQCVRKVSFPNTKPNNPLHPKISMHFSILFSIHVLRCQQGEFVQELLYVVIISSILMTLM